MHVPIQANRPVAGSLQMHVSSPADRGLWEDLLSKDCNSLVTQTPAWTDAICASDGYEDASRHYQLAGGRQIVLPMVRRKHVFGTMVTQASMPPSWGFGGLVSDHPVNSEEMSMIFADLAEQSPMLTWIRPNPLESNLWDAAMTEGVVRIPRRAHVLGLEGGFDEVWSTRFSSAARRNVRKAERAGLVVACDTSGKLVPVFHHLLRMSFDRWARQQHEPVFLSRWRGGRRDPLKKFQTIAEKLGDACRIWVAWINGKPAAAILVLQTQNAHYTRGAMNVELAGQTWANYLLHKLAIEDACNSGCSYYHMGESGTSEGLSFFKSRFGAVPHEYAEYRLERLPITAIDNRMRGIVKRVIGFKDA